MPQIFHPSANTLARVTIFGGAFAALGLLVVTYMIQRSPYQTQQGVIREQPIPFSHEHHVRGLGIDCRYCHTSVETAPYPGVPPTYTCMSCHSQIWTGVPMLPAGPRQPQGRQAAQVGPAPRPAGFRLLPPRHPRPEGDLVRGVPRAGRRDAADVEGEAADDGMVPGLPQAPRGARPAQGSEVFNFNWKAEDVKGQGRQAQGRPGLGCGRNTREGRTTSRSTA